MPRDGSGIYSQLFPDVASGTPISSAVYNGDTSDIAIDLNTPRPIVAGGTGASSASAALNNLSGEICRIEVTNYSSHPFQSGSFYSLATASGAPVSGHSFAGWCYPSVVGGIATTDMFIEVRDMTDSSVPPRIYVRQKIANVWGDWMVPAVGGSDPNFSGTIFINARHFATNDANATYILDPFIQNYADAGSSITLARAFYVGSNPPPGSVYHSYTHTFRGNISGTVTTFLTIAPNAATFSVPIAAGAIDAGAITATAPAAADDSNRVPSTNWVRTNVAASNFVAFPQNSRSSNYTLVLSDAGKQIYHPIGGSVTYTIPANATVPYPIGTTIMFVNQGSAVTIAIGLGDTMTLVNSTSTGSRTLSGTVTSMATAVKVNTTSWIIWGFGLT